MMAVFNGEIVPLSEARLSPTDAGVVFGATVTDYCRTFGGKLFRYPLHVERLRRDCAACFVPLMQSDAELIALAEELVRLNNVDESALITFATPGSEGGPTLVMHTFPVRRERYRSFFKEGVRLQPFDGSPVFPTAKHRSRLHWWRASHLVEDVPLLVSEGIVCETAIGNVLMVRDGEVMGAPSDMVLDGVSQRITRELSSHAWKEESFTVADLLAADEVLLVGSALGVAPVSRIGGVARDWGGPVYRALQQSWNEATGTVIPAWFLREE